MNTRRLVGFLFVVVVTYVALWVLLTSAVFGQDQGRPDPHAGQPEQCINHPHAEIAAHDCRCQEPAERARSCQKIPETRACLVFCRKKDCHCEPQGPECQTQ